MMNYMKVKDIYKGGIYAIRMPRTINRVTGEQEPFTMFDDEFDREFHMWDSEHCVSGQVISRVKGERTWMVRIDGKPTKVYHQQFAGRWDNYIEDVDVEAARERIADIIEEMGWVEYDSHTPMHMTIFGGPVGPIVDGKIRMEFTAEQAHFIADVMRDAQVREHARREAA